MVLLTTAAAFALLGIVVFVIGLVADRPELAMFGAVIVIGVGGTGVVQGYQVKVGENTTVIHDNKTVLKDDISKATEQQTLDISAETMEPTGLAFGAEGGTMFVSQTQSPEIDKYTISTSDLSFATYQASLDVSAQDSQPVGVSIEDGGHALFVSGDNTATVYKYNMSEAYNLSTATFVDSFNVSQFTSSPWDVEFSEDGTNMHIVGNDEAEIHEFDLEDPYNLSTVVFERTYSITQNADEPTGISFTQGGLNMILSGNGQGLVFQFELGRPYAIETASYTGNVLDTSTPVGVLSDAEYVASGETIVVADSQGDDLTVFDNSKTLDVEISENTDQYQDVEAISSFPLELIVLLLGAVMLMSGAGEASETGRDDPPWRRR